MLQIIRDLLLSPEAERAPDDWASRFLAHLGLAVVCWLGLVGLLGPEWSAVAVCAAYAVWEMLQWPGGRRMAFDGLLDWCAVASGVCALVFVWHQMTLAALTMALATGAIMLAGIWRRS